MLLQLEEHGFAVGAPNLLDPNAEGLARIGWHARLPSALGRGAGGEGSDATAALRDTSRDRQIEASLARGLARRFVEPGCVESAPAGAAGLQYHPTDAAGPTRAVRPVLVSLQFAEKPMTDKAADLRGFIARKVDETLARCTRCGRCYEVCPMPRYSEALAGAQPGTVVGGILAMLRGEPAAPDALEWARICTQSASCVPACPEGVDPMMMLRIARMAALGGFGGPRLIAGRDDPEFFLRIMAFARLQLTDEERAVWQRPPMRAREGDEDGRTGGQP